MTKKPANPVGRPRLYKSPEQMQKRIDEIFVEWGETETPPIISGLSHHLGFEHRDSFTRYADLYPEFSSTVKKAKQRVEMYLETRLYHNNATGSIFNLKNNFGWEDATKTDITTKDQPLTMFGQVIAPAKPTD